MSKPPASRGKLATPIFLEDPTRLNAIKIAEDHISPLNGNHWLGTTLIDYLIQRFILPDDVEESTVIPSSEFMSRMDFQMAKLSYKALFDVFPNNHSIHCAVHIQQNVWTKYGVKASSNVPAFAACFSQTDELLAEVEVYSRATRVYCNKCTREVVQLW
jgi:hypothetical protein